MGQYTLRQFIQVKKVSIEFKCSESNSKSIKKNRQQQLKKTSIIRGEGRGGCWKVKEAIGIHNSREEEYDHKVLAGCNNSTGNEAEEVSCFTTDWSSSEAENKRDWSLSELSAVIGCS